MSFCKKNQLIVSRFKGGSVLSGASVCLIKSEGEDPNSLAKHCLKYLRSEKPTIYTTSKTLYFFVLSNLAASCIRSVRMYSRGERPVNIFIFLYTSDRLMFRTSHSSLTLKSGLSRFTFSISYIECRNFSSSEFRSLFPPEFDSWVKRFR